MDNREGPGPRGRRTGAKRRGTRDLPGGAGGGRRPTTRPENRGLHRTRPGVAFIPSSGRRAWRLPRGFVTWPMGCRSESSEGRPRANGAAASPASLLAQPVGDRGTDGDGTATARRPRQRAWPAATRGSGHMGGELGGGALLRTRHGAGPLLIPCRRGGVCCGSGRRLRAGADRDGGAGPIGMVGGCAGAPGSRLRHPQSVQKALESLRDEAKA